MALEGGAVQKPLDLQIEDNPWDFFTEEGKSALEHLEDDPLHSDGDITGRIVVKGKGKAARVRSEEQPWGLDRISKSDQIKVRQDNKIAKRSLKGLESADVQGGYGGVEHP